MIEEKRLLNLTEDTRAQFVGKSRNADHYKHNVRGKNRFERKKYSKVANQVKSYNTIDMNKFFKQDLLEVVIPVQGETDDYEVTLQLEGVVGEIARNIKNNKNKFEYRTLVQAVTKIFNTTNIKVKCTCADFCLHKDTEIKLLDGRVLTVEKLLEEFNINKNLYLYSVNKDGDFAPGKINNVWISNYTSDMIKITLDNGREIITTPEHKYLLRTNEYKMAKDLIVGQSLMPLYFSKTENGYETVKANSESGTKFYSTYKIVANTLLQKEIEEAKIRSREDVIAIHHKDFNKNNNNPSNLYPMGFNEHYKYHYEHVKDSPMFEKFKAAGEEYRELVMDHASEEYKKQADVMRNAIINYYNNLSDDEAISYFKLNHKIISIEYIHYDEPIPVYDIEVDAYNNFYVDAGVILHNCYRYAHNLIINNNSVDDTAHDPGPGHTGMTAAMKGQGCKHVLLVLANQDWIMKVASCLKNYITYMDENKHGLFMKAIFPRLYDFDIDSAEARGIVPEDTNFDTDKGIITIINDWAKNRGKIQKGSNKNPVAQAQREKEAAAKPQAKTPAKPQEKQPAKQPEKQPVKKEVIKPEKPDAAKSKEKQ